MTYPYKQFAYPGVVWALVIGGDGPDSEYANGSFAQPDDFYVGYTDWAYRRQRSENAGTRNSV